MTTLPEIPEEVREMDRLYEHKITLPKPEKQPNQPLSRFVEKIVLPWLKKGFSSEDNIQIKGSRKPLVLIGNHDVMFENVFELIDYFSTIPENVSNEIFDLKQLDNTRLQLMEDLRVAVGRVKTSKIEVGRLLTELRDATPHGMWEPMLAAICADIDISRATAHRYMIMYTETLFLGQPVVGACEIAELDLTKKPVRHAVAEIVAENPHATPEQIVQTVSRRPKPIKEYETLLEAVPVIRAGKEIVPPSEYGAADVVETVNRFTGNLVNQPQITASDKRIIYRSLIHVFENIVTEMES